MGCLRPSGAPRHRIPSSWGDLKHLDTRLIRSFLVTGKLSNGATSFEAAKIGSCPVGDGYSGD